MTTPDIGQRMHWRHKELEKGGSRTQESKHEIKLACAQVVERIIES